MEDCILKPFFKVFSFCLLTHPQHPLLCQEYSEICFSEPSSGDFPLFLLSHLPKYFVCLLDEKIVKSEFTDTLMKSAFQIHSREKRLITIAVTISTQERKVPISS